MAKPMIDDSEMVKRVGDLAEMTDRVDAMLREGGLDGWLQTVQRDACAALTRLGVQRVLLRQPPDRSYGNEALRRRRDGTVLDVILSWLVEFRVAAWQMPGLIVEVKMGHAIQEVFGEPDTLARDVRARALALLWMALDDEEEPVYVGHRARWALLCHD